MAATMLPPPALQVAQWFNTDRPVTLQALRGRVVVLHAFQMLCPGCVSHGLPQARRLQRLCPPGQLAVVGLHTVFEHHEVMGRAAAPQAFIREYRLDFPSGMDQPDGHQGMRLTMQALRLRGTRRLLGAGPAGPCAAAPLRRDGRPAAGCPAGRPGGRGLPAAGDAAASAGCDGDGCPLPCAVAP